MLPLRRALDSVKHPALLFVDAVSALASIDFRMDEWAVDICVSGSQKGLMLPAGLGVICVSQKALEAAKTARSRRCYFDFADMVQANAGGYFPYTPSLPHDVWSARIAHRCSPRKASTMC